MKITSPEGRFSATFSNRIQLRYDYADIDGASDVSDFDVRRLRPAWTGHVYTEDLTYTIVPDVADGWSMLVAVMNYRVNDQFQIRLGQGKTPYGYERYTSSGRLGLVDRSLVSGAFDHAFPDGVMFHGKFPEAGNLTYEVGVFNQGERNQDNPDDNHLLVGRVDLEPAGEMAPRRLSYPSAPISDTRWRLGVAVSVAESDFNAIQGEGSLSGYQSTLLDALEAQDGFDQDDLNDADLLAVNPDFGVQIQNFSLHGEYHYAEADPSGTGDGDAEVEGYMLQAGFFLDENWQVVTRYSEVDDDNASNAEIDQDEIIGGVNWFSDGHGLKVQADVGQVENDVTGDEDTRFRVQTQITF